MQYNDIAPKIKPFDLIGFRGGDYVSRLIQELEEKELGMSEFSHVGVIVTSEILEKAGDVILEPDKLYVFESTYSFEFQSDGVPDVASDKGMFGVQLRDFEEVTKKYFSTGREKIAWCKLIDNPFDLPANREHLKTIFTELYNRYHDTTYDISMIDLVSSLIAGARGLRDIRDHVTDKIFDLLSWTGLVNSESLKPSEWQFCSELVATVYQGIGVISEEINTKDVVPMDFFGCDKDGIPLLVKRPIYIDIENR